MTDTEKKKEVKKAKEDNSGTLMYKDKGGNIKVLFPPEIGEPSDIGFPVNQAGKNTYVFFTDCVEVQHLTSGKVSKKPSGVWA